MAKDRSLLYAIIGILVLSIMTPLILYQNNNALGKAPEAGDYFYVIIGRTSSSSQCTEWCYRKWYESDYIDSYTVKAIRFSYDGNCVCRMTPDT
jgi:hypothetical protein